MGCVFTNLFCFIFSAECFFIAFTGLFLLLSWRHLKSYRNLPPGPLGLPIVGYFPFLKNKSHVHLNELAQIYGDIFSLYLGRKLVVVLNSYEAIKETFVKQAEIFAGRLRKEILEENEIPSIFNSEGEIWKDYRRFTLKTLRDFGIGKLAVEPRIKEEISFLLKVFESYNNKPVDIGNLLRMSISNVICAIKFGHRFNYEDESFQNLMSVLGEHLKRSHPFDYFIYIPKILKIPGIKKILGHKYLSETRDLLVEDIKKRIDKYNETYQPGSENDFISTWLTEAIKKGPKEGKNFTVDHLVQVSRSLFIAGTDTTSNTLRWALLYLMKFPNIQTHIQMEIDNVIGHERLPSMTDKEQMPFTEATLLEVLRISSLTPLSLLHSNIKETTVRGYTIPKRCVIVPNLWAVHHDPKTYPEPDKFQPERFLDKDRKIIRPEKLIPFSLGKRQCLGESLAKMELFLYLTSMLQRFSFQKPEGDEITFDCEMATTLCPRPYNTVITLREEANKHL